MTDQVDFVVKQPPFELSSHGGLALPALLGRSWHGFALAFVQHGEDGCIGQGDAREGAGFLLVEKYHKLVASAKGLLHRDVHAGPGRTVFAEFAADAPQVRQAPRRLRGRRMTNTKKAW